MKNKTVMQYLDSLKDDVYNIDFFCQERQVHKNVCLFVLNECILVLEDIKHPDASHNSIVQNKIDFLNECVSSMIKQPKPNATTNHNNSN